jgi:CRP-like cAMP-binding protein
MLFIEGQQPRGVFVLCAGKAELSTSSSDGKTIITKISEAGDVLGLNARSPDGLSIGQKDRPDQRGCSDFYFWGTRGSRSADFTTASMWLLFP